MVDTPKYSGIILAGEMKGFRLSIIIAAILIMAFSINSQGQKQLNNEQDPDYFTFYQDGKKGGMWGLEKTNHSEFSISKEFHYSGKSSLHLKWHVAEGDNSLSLMGFSFKTKNILAYLDSMAISFYVRSAEGTVIDLPMVFILQSGPQPIFLSAPAVARNS